jgi:hypothetical protein
MIFQYYIKSQKFYSNFQFTSHFVLFTQLRTLKIILKFIIRLDNTQAGANKVHTGFKNLKNLI